MFKTCLKKNLNNDVKLPITELKSYQSSDLVWDNGSTLRVFLNSDNQDHKNYFMQLMQTHYEPEANLHFEETTNFNSADIQVNFTNDGVSWSKIGTTSKLQTYVHTPTSIDYSMQIGEVEQDTILHEIGHALGWFHEHTHPDKPWRFHKEIVISELKAVGWTEEEVQTNVLTERKNNDETPYDEYSIMHYYLPSHWTIPNMQFSVNTVLSAQDKYSLHLTYPYPLASEKINEICDGFCHPSETQIHRKLWDSSIRIAFCNNCTAKQKEIVKAVIRVIYMPFFPYTVHYVNIYDSSHIRILFGPSRLNKSVCGKQQLVYSNDANVSLYSKCHVAAIIHHIGHVFGLRDNYLTYNCGNISSQLYDYLQERPKLENSIMSNQKQFSINNFYLSKEDKADLLYLYGTNINKEDNNIIVEEEDEPKQNYWWIILFVVLFLFIVFIVLYSIRKNKRSKNNYYSARR